MIDDGAHTYQYDSENRLVKVDNGSSGVYSYDTANCRVKKEVGGYTTYCIWQGGLVIAEYSDAPTQGSGGLKYYEADRLSTRLVTSSTGSVLGTQDHMPFGEEAGVAGESEKHRFTNYERDGESGTDWAVNRQYQAINGRFMRPDPVGGDVADPQSLNRYAYVANDPVNSVDPLGLLVRFLTYEYQYYTTTLDGEDAVGMRVVATQHCYDIGGGGGGRAVSGGDLVGGGGGGGGRWTFPGTEAIINKLNAIKKKICDTIPSGRTVGVSGSLGLVSGPVVGGELVINYNSGQVSAFGFGGAQVGWNGGASASVYSGLVYGLNDSNSKYSGGFTGGNLGTPVGSVFGAASSGGLTGGAKGAVSLQAPYVLGVGFGASAVGDFSGGFSATHYSKPLQLGKHWAIALNLGLRPESEPFFGRKLSHLSNQIQ